MTFDGRAETKRGYAEASKQFEVLHAKWPKAFPTKSHEVRPLIPGTVATVVKELGWSQPYARAVLKVWKRRDAYCRAILAYTARIGLDGSVSDFTVDDKARADARALIEQRQAKRQRNAEKATLRVQSLELSANDQHLLAEALINPPRPKEALKRAGDAYRRHISV